MNKNLVQMDDNSAFVSDENGNVSLVRSENDEVKLEDILNVENELETSTYQYELIKDELEELKLKFSYGKMANVGALLCGAYICGMNVILSGPLNLGLFGGITGYLMGKGFSLLVFGSRVGRNKKKKQLSDEKLEIEGKIVELNKELENMKEKVSYEKKSIDTVEYNYELPLAINNVNKVKVRKLVKDNNKNS